MDAEEPRKINARLVLNVVIGALALLVAAGSYALFLRPQPKAEPVPVKPSVLQLDVQNGCGSKGAAARFTSFLRANGFDVVEMKNYKTSHIPQTLVIDRVGDLAAARRVASSLGVSQNNIIQQINPD